MCGLESVTLAPKFAEAHICSSLQLFPFLRAGVAVVKEWTLQPRVKMGILAVTADCVVLIRSFNLSASTFPLLKMGVVTYIHGCCEDFKQ